METPARGQLEADIAKLEQQMADPAVFQDAQKMKRLSRELGQKKEVLEVVIGLENATRQLAEATELAAGDDAEMKALAEDDITRLTAEQAKLADTLQELLTPKDPRDERDVILEIRAGAGGDEASLFASELFRAYTRYGETHGWTTHSVSSSKSEQGGFKEVIAEVSGNAVFGTLKYERGVHRVQRVPETEKQGRIHTSTVTVAVLPQAEEADIEIKAEDLRIDTYRASGAGGQHVNKTDSAIRITHEPTGTVVAVQDERSQHKNKSKAMKILRSRLLEAQEATLRQAQGQARKEQVGTGDRSEKIRTYNYPQDRITDHRIKQNWSNIPGVMDGNLKPLFEALTQAARSVNT